MTAEFLDDLPQTFSVFFDEFDAPPPTATI
jgi:hypothetical protein